MIASKDALVKALTKLLEKYDIEEITVAMLCKEAKVNRSVFFTYFAHKADFLEFYSAKLRAEKDGRNRPQGFPFT